MANKLTLQELSAAVSGNTAAFRVNAKLQPAGGPNDKVFPPTYSGGVYATEERLIEGKRLPCVLLDSVQSQANRLEEALRNAWERNDDDNPLRMPMILTDFSNVDVSLDEGLTEAQKTLVKNSVQGVGQITTLDAPHRIADAIFRDSVTENGDNFRDEYSKAFDANISNATALFEYCPTALIFGTWDSTGSRGGLGNKFARALVSEIVGINAVAGNRTSSRIDPLGISSKVPLYETSEGGWTTLRDNARTTGTGANAEPVPYASKAGKGNPSAVNHSNVTPDYVRFRNDDITKENRDTPDTVKRDGSTITVNAIKPGGVTIDYALQCTVLSLPALRRLRFPGKNGSSTERNAAARTVLTALGIVAIAEQYEQGYFLRSRCDLVREETSLTIERVNSATISDEDKFTLTAAEAIAILNEAVEAAKAHELAWNTEPVKLTPKPELVTMVSKSREIELGSEAE